MNDSKQGPASVTEGVWPPAPSRDEPPPLFLRVEGMQLTRSGDRLIIVNRFSRRLFVFEVCILSASLLSPFISFLTSPFHRVTLPGLLPYVISGYRSNYGLHLFMLCVIAGFWCLFNSLCNLSGVTLDGRDATVKADGKRTRPMSGIKAIHIRMTPHPFQGRQHIVRLLWIGGKPVPKWQTDLTGVPDNSSFLVSFRHEANADQVAGIIAAFIGVPVQKMNGIVAPSERDQRL